MTSNFLSNAIFHFFVALAFIYVLSDFPLEEIVIIYQQY